MGSVKICEWDSEFFGYPVGNLVVDTESLNEDFLEEVLAQERKNFRLIYLVLSNQSLFSPDFCAKLGMSLVDSKVVYEKHLQAFYNENILASRICEVGPDSYNLLESLALQSGAYSRYRLDPNFKKNEYERLYKEWLLRSLGGVIADTCLAYFHEGTPIGLVTMKHMKEETTIGIIAVSEEARGRGVGSSLLSEVEKASLASGLRVVTVATQKTNTSACRFYEMNGYRPKNMSNIYHLWNKCYDTFQ